MQADKALDEKAQLMYEKMKLQKQQEAAVLQKKAATTGAAEAPKPTPVKPEAVSYSHRLTACRMLVVALPVRKSKPNHSANATQCTIRSASPRASGDVTSVCPVQSCRTERAM